jgi:hypothetical protein
MTLSIFCSIEYRYAECRHYLIVMLNVKLLSVIMLIKKIVMCWEM